MNVSIEVYIRNGATCGCFRDQLNSIVMKDSQIMIRKAKATENLPGKSQSVVEKHGTRYTSRNNGGCYLQSIVSDNAAG